MIYQFSWTNGTYLTVGQAPEILACPFIWGWGQGHTFCWLLSSPHWYLFFFFNFGCTHSIWKFPGQRSNPSHSYNWHQSHGHTRSLTLCARSGIKPMPQQWPEPLQRQHWVLNLPHHSRNSPWCLLLVLLGQDSILSCFFAPDLQLSLVSNWL